MCGEVDHETYVTASCVQLLEAWMFPASFPLMYSLNSKVVLGPCRDHRPAREGSWGQCSLSGRKAAWPFKELAGWE